MGYLWNEKQQTTNSKQQQRQRQQLPYIQDDGKIRILVVGAVDDKQQKTSTCIEEGGEIKIMVTNNK